MGGGEWTTVLLVPRPRMASSLSGPSGLTAQPPSVVRLEPRPGPGPALPPCLVVTLAPKMWSTLRTENVTPCASPPVRHSLGAAALQKAHAIPTRATVTQTTNALGTWCAGGRTATGTIRGTPSQARNKSMASQLAAVQNKEAHNNFSILEIAIESAYLRD